MRKAQIMGTWLVIVLFVAGACVSPPTTTTTPPTTTTTTPPTTTTTTPPTTTPPATTAGPIEITAAQLVAEYEADETAADAKYRSQWLEITGTVDYYGDIGIIDSTNHDKGLPVLILSGIQVHLLLDARDIAATLPVGAKAIVIGKCKGKTGVNWKINVEQGHFVQ